jgi:hypothetical protein
MNTAAESGRLGQLPAEIMSIIVEQLVDQTQHK